MIAPNTPTDLRIGVVFVCYGTFNCNSAGHIAGFANALAQRGCTTAVVAAGDPRAAWDFGRPSFQCFSHEAIANETPPQLAALLESPRTIVHGWTPRETVRKLIAKMHGRNDLQYCVHLEDNEEFILQSQLGLSENELANKSPEQIDALVPDGLSHPVYYKEFLRNSAGVTIITPALTRFVPPEIPSLVLEPGVDPYVFASDLTDEERDRRRAALGIDRETTAIFYHGALHPSNRRELHSLYTSILILKRRGYNVHLLRSGHNVGPDFDRSMDFIRQRYVTEFGWLDRKLLINMLKLADLYIQPGAGNAFNLYRLPSKIPEFLALGRPVLLPKANIGLRLKGGIEALLLDKGDGLEIAAKVQGLLDDPAAARRIGCAGRAFALRELSWDDKAALLERFYAQLLERPVTH